MTVKYMNKDKLQLIDGMVCNKKGEVLGIDPEIVELYNELETKVQEKHYLDKQPEAQPMPSLDGFERKHSVGNVWMPIVEVAKTPVTDKRIEEAIAFAKEMGDVHKADVANETIAKYAKLFQFVEQDKILVDTANIMNDAFDRYVLDDPLTMTKECLTDVIMFLVDIDAKEKED